MTNDQNRNGKSLSEKQVEMALKELSMKPSEEIKRKSFQRALAGIDHARVDSNRIKRVMKMKKWTKRLVITGVTAATLMFVAINFEVIQDRLNAGLNSSNQPPTTEETPPVIDDPDDEEFNENETNENETNENESNEDEMNEDEMNEEERSYPEVDRPLEKEIVVYPEGMEETRSYQLLNEENLPFTSYVPLGWEMNSLDFDNSTGVSISPDNDIGELQIVFFDQLLSEQEVLDAFFNLKNNESNAEEITIDEEGVAQAWVVDRFLLFGDRVISATLGQYDNHYFYILSTYIPEAGDGWAPVKAVLYDEWEWKRTGEPLEVGSRINQMAP